MMNKEEAKLKIIELVNKYKQIIEIRSITKYTKDKTKKNFIQLLSYAFVIAIVVLALSFYSKGDLQRFPQKKQPEMQDKSDTVQTIINSKSKENLQDRIRKYNTLISNGGTDLAYEFLTEAFKAEGTKSEVYKIMQKHLINEDVEIRNDIGYAKSVITICENDDCSKLFGYRAWIYVFDNWYLSNDEVGCLKESPYPRLPEFNRALSLYEQRINTFLISKGLDEYDFSYFNCLNINYSETNEEEAYFTFNPEGSSLDNLQIFVNKEYREKDDLLTTYILAHEIYHAISFIHKVNFGEIEDCVDEEVNAFSNQLFFTQTLMPEEHKILNLRFQEGYSEINPPLKMMWDLWAIKKNADSICGEDNNCYNKQLTLGIKNKVKNNPYYQKQCRI